MTNDRIEQVAAVLACGLTAEELRHGELKRVLSLLEELDDVEVLILRAYAHPEPDGEFWSKHEGNVVGPDVPLGSPQQDVERELIYNARIQHLQNQGLLSDKKRTSELGQLLLRRIGQLPGA